MNNPRCPVCAHVFPWFYAMKRLLGPTKQNRATWGIVCPSCQTDLRVTKGRVMLIAASGIFFGSQTSTMLVLTGLNRFSSLLAMLWLIVGFYAIAIFVLLKLEPLE